MGRSSLGRVLDPSALDACAGPRARLRVEVPAAWLAEGADLVVTAPSRLACARCDGGGCDTCARSGALRAPAEAGERVVRASLSPDPDGERSAVTLRISRPFGAEHGIHQLLLEICVAETASACVVRIAPSPAPILPVPGRLPWPIVVLAAIATILFALFGR